MIAQDTIQATHKAFFETDTVIDSGSLAGRLVDSISGDHTIVAVESCPLAVLSIFSLIICLASIFLVYWIYTGKYRIFNKIKESLRSFKKRFVKNRYVQKIKIFQVFGAIWCLNFVVYDVGMSTSSIISLLTNAPMAMLHAFGAFVLDNDVSEIQNTFHSSWLFMMGFSLSHMLAAIFSTLFLLKHFGFNIREKEKMIKLSKTDDDVDDTYIFFGIDDASCNLIKSIQSKYKSEKGKKDSKNRLGSYEIIAIRTNKDDDDDPENRTGIWRIFDFLSIKTSELDRLTELNCNTACTYADLSKINIPQEGSTEDVFGSHLKLKYLKDYLDKRARKNIHLFFLSDDENDNIHATLLLLKDVTLKKFSEKSYDVSVESENDENHTNIDNVEDTNNDDAKKKSNPEKCHVIYYCHARYNSIHRVIEDQHRSDNEIVKIVDSSHINVEMLKQDPRLLPVNYVEVEKDAKVSTDFHALVVGFSEVGQDSVKFLYEFGAFVADGSDDEKPRRSAFRLDVVDKNMSDLAGTFVCNAPAISPRLTFMEEGEKPIELNKSKRNDENNPEKKDLIVLHEMDCRSVQFYKKLEEWIKTLNYIVIATEDDELNLSLGVRIFKLAIRYRENFEEDDKFCILVRTHQDADGHAFRIINHYNRLWAAEKVDAKNVAAGKIEKKKLEQTEFKRNGDVNGPLYLFGLDTKTYTFDNIVDDSLEKKAVDYKERYEAATEADYTEPDSDEKKAWYRFIRKRLQLEDGGTYSPTYSSLMKLRRTLGQDMANSLHELTKRLLIEKALRKLNKDNFDFTIVSRSTKDVKFQFRGEEDKEIQLLLLVIAQTEHLRWNASHEILGYIYDEKLKDKDEMRLHHVCLTDWENLSDYTKSFDFNIVDLTMDDLKKDKQ